MRVVLTIEASLHPAYPPGILNRFFGWVERLPIPWWAFYLGLAAVLVSGEALVTWSGTPGTRAAYPVVYAATAAYNLALIHLLDRIAKRALHRFRPLLNVDEAEARSIQARLVTLPARLTLIVLVAGALFGAAQPLLLPVSLLQQELGYAISPVSLVFNIAVVGLVWATAFAWVFHTIHQLRVVRSITARAANVNLLAPGPIHAFSILSAATAIAIMAITVIIFATGPTLASQTSSVVVLIFFSMLSFLAFLVPLQGARTLLVEEKSKRLKETGERMVHLYRELHRRVDTGEMGNMGELNLALASLELERNTLNHVSVLPWPKEVFRVVSVALLSPLAWWLVQWILTDLAGP